jgi:hypothetical protein
LGLDGQSEQDPQQGLAHLHQPAFRRLLGCLRRSGPAAGIVALGGVLRSFLHMPLMEDYSAAARDLQSAVDNPASITPIRWRFDWRYGLVDGAPPTARSRFLARLPRPPHDFGERDGHGPERSAPRADHKDPALGRSTAERRSCDRSGGDDTVGACGRSCRSTDNRYTRGRDPGRDAHPARDSRDTRGRTRSAPGRDLPRRPARTRPSPGRQGATTTTRTGTTTIFIRVKEAS